MDRTSKVFAGQIEAEIAWQRLQRDKIEDSVTVGDEEVKAVLAKLTASKRHWRNIVSARSTWRPPLRPNSRS